MLDRVGVATASVADQKNDSRQYKLESFAKCLNEKGYRMYSLFTCSHSRAQRKSFGSAFKYIQEIESNPSASNTQVERCLKNKIRKLPTWIQEVDGREQVRLEGCQLLEVLTAASGCDY
ncbi:MAG: hypothetical protein KDF49_12320 [Nitrosomonas sp.]|nr:hypothetical protein [Nitrosomonas sp.]